MDQINLTELKNQLSEFAKERDWEQFHSVKNLVMALSVESSELLEIFQWLTPDQADQLKTNPDLKMHAQEEIADIFIYLLRVATKLEINISDAVADKMIKNAEKYPVDLARGKSLKYTNLLK